MKVGDTVRYLNATGGGIVKKIEGNIAYVEEDGFETPVMVRELVVVIPAGHKASAGARLMFDQEAYDAGKSKARSLGADKKAPAREDSLPDKDRTPAPEEPQLPLHETDYGDRLSLSLAFEPSDVKSLSASTFNAVLVNDSNYFVTFAFSRRGDGDKGWTLLYQGTVAPNELIDLASFTPAELPGIERIALQGVAFKKEKCFELKDPIAVSRRIDITKFHKFHCFRPGLYFDTPVLELPILSDDKPAGREQPTPAQLNALERSTDKVTPKAADRKKKASAGKEPSPTKLLEPVEVDLHIGELTDTTAGMSNSDMLNLQLYTVRKVMKSHEKRKGQKIIFIHGKGEGVLRQAVHKLLRKEYPQAGLQDASFREYGFGATLVTVH